MSGRPWGGDHGGEPPRARSADRVAASANSLFARVAAIGRAVAVPAHTLDATGDERVALPRLDRVRRHADRLQRRRAVAVDGRARARRRGPTSTATTRAMLKPCSPAGEPHPIITSSISVGASCGTCPSTAFTIEAVRSSGRTSTSDPLNARPIGLRAVATITASGMRQSSHPITVWAPAGLCVRLAPTRSGYQLPPPPPPPPPPENPPPPNPLPPDDEGVLA